MPVILPGTSISYLQQTTTVENILDACVNDTMRIILKDNGLNQDIMIDYVNRVQQEVLRFARWPWMLSTVQRFLTKVGQTDYWLATTGSAPAGAVDTGLNLTDIHQLKEGTVFDRTNFRNILKVEEGDSTRALFYPDGSAVPGVPKQWREDPTTNNIINIYPAPDRSNGLYRPVPETPFCTTVAGGALSARIYFVRTTLIDSNSGESTANAIATRIFVPAGYLLVVKAPQPPISASSDGILYNKYKVYASTTEGSEKVQNSGTAILTTVDYTEPTSGITSSGVAYPTTNTLEPLYGYVIEFRYFKQRTLLTDIAQTVQIPDIYAPIVIAGTNGYIYTYLSNAPGEMGAATDYSRLAAFWQDKYRRNLIEIIKDFNLSPKGSNFISPDSIMSQNTRFWY